MIALVVGVVVIYVGYQYYIGHKSPSYDSSVDIRIGLQAPPHSTSPTFTDYVTTAETLADEFATGPTLKSTAFGEQVTQQIREDRLKGDLGDWTNPSAITSALSLTRTHSVVTIDVNWPTEAGAGAIARAVGEVLTTHMSEYLDYQVSNQPANSADYPVAAAKVINQIGNAPTVVVSTSTTKTSLLLALLAVGLILGIALAFLVEYLDDRIYDTSEVIKTLQLPIYGEIPRASTSGHSRARSSAA